MYAAVVIRQDLTIAQFGHDPATLNKGSHEFVTVECTGCHTIMRREFRGSHRRHSCPIVVGEQKRCHRCRKWKDLSLFNKNGKLSGGVAKMCKECYNNHPAVKKLEYQRSVRLKNATNDGDYKFYIKRRISRLLSKARLDSVPCNIDIQYMVRLWEKQCGRCYYTSILMTGSGTNKGLSVWNSPSVDRVKPALGYVRGNVVWCLNSVNSFKGQLTADEFKTVIEQIGWWFERPAAQFVGARQCRLR